MTDQRDDAHAQFWNALAACRPTDVPQLIDEAERTRAARVEAAFRDGAALSDDGNAIDQRLFDRMWLGDDLGQVNDVLRDDMLQDLNSARSAKDSTTSPAYGLYSLVRNTRLISFFHCFGSKSGQFPGRLSPDNEQLLVELLWWRTAEKNDIAISRRSTWWMAGSENHDLNNKVSCLLASAILADSPDWADRPLPDRGYGCAPGYHNAGFNPDRQGTERANWSNGNAYTSADHCRAWVDYLKDYFAERVRRGFFLENGSPGYMRYTISYILLLYNFCPDGRLKQQAKMFLDLFWADWALQQLGGLRGGPKTRHHSQAGQYDAMSDWARFYLGGPGLTAANYCQQLIGDYDWNPLIWELVIDRQGLGSFAYISRGIGEEEQTCPRPMGVERTMTGNCESRMVKYSWVTPDYVLGTQMDHPLAVHNHLSAAGRWQGLITADLDARIATVSMEAFPGKTHKDKQYSLELMYHSVQHKQVLITQQKRRWMQINPDWFPSNEKIHDVPFGLYIGSGWTTRDERDGWLFLEHGDAFAAVRVLLLKADEDPLAWAKGTDRFEGVVEFDHDAYTWDDTGTLLRLNNMFSPIIIEAGRREDHATLADFQKRILTNKLAIHRTVVTRQTRFIIVYRGAEGAEIVFNAANHADIPTIEGEPIDYRHPMIFDAPYLRSEYNSGIVEITKGDRRQVLDFNQAGRPSDKREAHVCGE